jgi:DNA-binding NarL/FixJ family response regulator
MGAYENPKNVSTHIKQFNPDLLIMDIDMPGMNGIEAVTEVRASNKEIPILMLTVFDDNLHVFDAICAGASGYLLKKHLSTKLFSAIEEALDGGAPMSPSIARMVLTSMQQKTIIENPYQLTPKEKEVLTSLSKGSSYKMIAAEHEISLDTVRSHIRKIYEKLHVHSQTEAVSKAINEKLV